MEFLKFFYDLNFQSFSFDIFFTLDTTIWIVWMCSIERFDILDVF